MTRCRAAGARSAAARHESRTGDRNRADVTFFSYATARSLGARFIVVHDLTALLGRVSLGNLGIVGNATSVDGRRTGRPMLVQRVGFWGLRVVVNRRQVVVVVLE
jgi:hypothetical protein